MTVVSLHTAAQNAVLACCNTPTHPPAPAPLHTGAYQPPAAASTTMLHPLHAHMESIVHTAETAVERLVEVVSGVAHEAAEVSRRLLQEGTGVYPPSPSPPVASPPAPGIVYRTVDVVQIWPEGQVPGACNPATSAVDQGESPALQVCAVPALTWAANGRSLRLCVRFRASVA